MPEKLKERLLSRVPRYTSYPTAPHFAKGVAEETYREWLAALNPQADLSLYFHVPFCDTLCWFCGCHTKVVNGYGAIAHYLDHLVTEIDLVAEVLQGRHRVDHIHWGGGSPTGLQPDDMIRIGRAMDARFDRTESCEFAVEIDPRGLDRARIDALAEIGVNRASIGIQDLNPRVQKAINRIQTFDETLTVIEGLRDAGIDALNIDLMYGLPHQMVDDVLASVEATIDLSPGRIALFGYAHVPELKRHQKLINEQVLPNETQRFAQVQAARQRLLEAGYVRVGLDHFARADDTMATQQASGTLRRNFQGYTTDQAEALIGLGASAIGQLPQGFLQNNPDIRAYNAAVADGRLPISRGLALTDDDRLRGAVIERLMCDMVVDLDPLCKSFGALASLFEEELLALEELAQEGLVVLEGTRIVVTEAGRPFLRNIASVFDAYFAPVAGRHSVAV